MLWSLSWARTNFKLDQAQGARSEALSAINIASLIFRPDLGVLGLDLLPELQASQLELWKLLPDFPAQASFPRFPAMPAAPGNIHNRSRLLLTNKTRPRFAATSFDDFAIPILRRL
jgi:hypothetical protein